MRIKRGWSTDYGQNRFDAEAEETDLLRVLTEAGFEDPEAVAACMKASDVMRVLDAEVMSYVHFTLASHEPPKRDDHLAKVREHVAARDRILAKYRPADAGNVES